MGILDGGASEPGVRWGTFHIDTSDLLYSHMEGGNDLPGAFYKSLTLFLKVLSWPKHL